MDKILTEQNFSNSDRANPTSAAKLGKILGVDAIIVGSVTQFGGENQNTKVGGGGGGWGGYGIGGFSHKKSKAICVVDARLVNIDTAGVGRCPRQGRVLAREHFAARRRRQLAWMGRWRGGFRQ